MKWTIFIETFTTAVNSQDPLSAIEIFTYLKGQSEGPSADCIQGISLTSKNYEEAKQLLEERFSNPQIIISADMNILLKLSKLNNDSVSRLSSFDNAIESRFKPVTLWPTTCTSWITRCN